LVRTHTRRVDEVVAAAARVFIAHGYGRTQVQDIADALGVAKGTVYGYAESKDALFAAAVRYADGDEPLPEPGALPMSSPQAGEVASLVTTRLAGEVADMALTRALDGSGNAGLALVVVDLYQRLARHRIAIKLVDRCAPELPDLADVWFGSGRHAQVGGLHRFLEQGVRDGRFSLPGPTPLVARTILELVTLWAVHCHFDQAPATHGHADEVDDAVIAATLAELFVRATLPGTT